MQESIPQLYRYRSARQFLLDYVTAKQRIDRKFTLRSWTKEMGMRTHTLLVMILNGKRKISLKQVPYFVKGLSLNPQDQLYFQAMVQYEDADTAEEKHAYELLLSQHSTSAKNDSREIDQFWMISDWIHMAILEIMNLKGFDGTSTFLKSKLSHAFTSHEVLAAIRRLRTFKLIEEIDGKLTRSWGHVTTQNDVPNLGVQEYHKQVSELAKIAVDQQSQAEREFQGFAISVANEDLEHAKAMIREFRTKFCKSLSTRPGDEVYQMNLQFFKLTDCLREPQK